MASERRIPSLRRPRLRRPRGGELAAPLPPEPHAPRVEEIAAVPGFGTKTAIAIKQQLQATPVRESVNTATGEIMEA